MDQTVTKAADLIRTRLAELDRERQQLESALKALNGQAAARTAHRPQSRRPRRRAARGQRQQQFLAQVKKAPGARVSEIAKAIKVAPTQLYPIAKKLEADGQIKRQDKGYVAA